MEGAKIGGPDQRPVASERDHQVGFAEIPGGGCRHAEERSAVVVGQAVDPSLAEPSDSRTCGGHRVTPMDVHDKLNFHYPAFILARFFFTSSLSGANLRARSRMAMAWSRLFSRSSVIARLL